MMLSPGSWLLSLAVTATALLLVARSSEADCTFTGLGDLAGGAFESSADAISADGSVVVGVSESAAGFEAFRWTQAGGIVGLGDLAGGEFDSYANGVSADGMTVVGGSESVSGFEAFRWTSGGGLVGLGDFAGGNFDSGANDVSADGSVVVGSGSKLGAAEAFRWTGAGGMVGLGTLGGNDGAATGVSNDGTVVVGRDLVGGVYQAFRWTQAGGLVGLGDLPGGTPHSSASDVSADGLVVVGTSVGSNLIDEPILWTSGDGMRSLGEIAGGSFEGNARAIADDGATVVGSAAVGFSTRAFVWSPADGRRFIADVLAACSIDLTGWTLEVATDISADGLTIVGTGTNPDGQSEGWVAAVPEPGLGPVLAFGTLLLSSRARRCSTGASRRVGNRVALP